MHIAALIRKVKETPRYLLTLRIITCLSAVFFTIAVVTNMSDSLWRDEAFSALVVKLSPSHIIQIAIIDNNPPLYHLLEHFITQIIGMNEFSLRLISLLAIIGTILLLRKMLQNPVLREVVTIIALVNANMYLQATEGRYYALFMLLTLLSFFFLQKAAKELKIQYIVPYMLVSIALLYTHTLGIVIYIVQSVLFFILMLRYQKANIWKGLSIFFPISIVIFISYIPWIFVIIKQYTSFSQTPFWLTFQPIISPVNSFLSLSFLVQANPLFPPVVLATINSITAAISIVIWVVGAYYLLKEKKYLAVTYFFSFFLIFYFVSFKQPILYIRYILFLLPIYMVIASYGITHIYKVITYIKPNFSRYVRTIPVLATLVWFLVSIGIYIQFYSTDYKIPAKELSGVVASSKTENYIVVMNDESLYYPCKYYFRNCLIDKKYEDINKSIGISLLPMTDLITKVKLNTLEHILWLSTNPKLPTTDGLLGNYTLEKEFAATDNAGSLYAYFYTKTG